jgi:hypothetical protein
MAYTRKQVADTIKSLRYAVKSGACTIAHFHLRTLRNEHMGTGTWERLQSTVNRCKVSPNFRKRRRR